MAHLPKSHRRRWQRYKFINGAIASLISIPLIAACADTYDREFVTHEPGEAIEEIATDSANLIGQTVTVYGEVEAVLDANTIEIEEREVFDSERILVVNVDPLATALTDGQSVEVTGEVQTFSAAALQQQYDLSWTPEIQQQLEAEYAGQAVLIAQRTEPGD